MKTRNGFVSNSSSCSFTIYNKSSIALNIVDFIKENPGLIERFKQEYDHNNDPSFTQEKLIKSAEERLQNKLYHETNVSPYVFPSNSRNNVIFGDEDGDLIGHVFDYMLRDGGESEHFSWELNEMLR